MNHLNSLSKIDRDGLIRRCFLPLLCICILSAAALGSFTDISVYEALPLIAVPLILAGLMEMILGRRWAGLIVVIILCLVAALYSVRLSIIMAYLIVGAEGIATVAACFQKSMFFRVMEHMECDGPSAWGRLLRFLFGVSDAIDPRDLVSDRSIIRHNMPWSDMVGTAFLALLPMLMVWCVIMIMPGVGGAGLGHQVATVTLIMYAVLIALIPIILRSLNVRIRSYRGGFVLYSGLSGSAMKAVLVLLVVFVVAAISPSDPGEVGTIIVSAVIAMMMVVTASVAYYLHNEADVADDIRAKWGEFRPVDLYCPLTPKNVPSLHDGVPGTPMRRDRE